MEPERWNRIERFYHAALEHEPGGRAAFLAEVCPEPDLRREVESLLGFDGSGDSMLEHPAWAKGIRAGERLGPYEILDRIGKGGMGEVWRARDPRLNREVAIKISAQQFSDRFEREARSIAALNHPNICHVYDVGPNYLVMELVEGENVRKGPLPLDEALRIARQIADALEAAHEKGIVHRDLKPANIKIRPDGTVKVLDFGLAKVGRTQRRVRHSPIRPPWLSTHAGMILGTAAYMAPEQARGKVVDKRADIWAFGVVLYEMLTGKRLFEGEDLTDTLASVVTGEPRLDGVPAKVRRLLRKCLEKDPRNGVCATSATCGQLLDDAPAQIAPTRSRLAWGVAALLALIAAVALCGVPYLRPKPPAAAVQRFELTPPEIGGPGQRSAVSVSPDGTRLVFSDRGPTGTRLAQWSVGQAAGFGRISTARRDRGRRRSSVLVAGQPFYRVRNQRWQAQEDRSRGRPGPDSSRCGQGRTEASGRPTAESFSVQRKALWARFVSGSRGGRSGDPPPERGASSCQRRISTRPFFYRMGGILFTCVPARRGMTNTMAFTSDRSTTHPAECEETVARSFLRGLRTFARSGSGVPPLCSRLVADPIMQAHSWLSHSTSASWIWRANRYQSLSGFPTRTGLQPPGPACWPILLAQPQR